MASQLLAIFAIITLTFVHSDARQISCMKPDPGILDSVLCITETEPPLPTSWDPLVREILMCKDSDKVRGTASNFEVNDDVDIICFTLLYEVDIALPEFHLRIEALFRGAWNRRPEELQYKRCRDMCSYFVRQGTVSIHLLHVRPKYFGCYHEENKNNEDITKVDHAAVVDCSKFGPLEEGSGLDAGWIVFIILMCLLLVLIVAAVALWWFKFRN